MASFATFSDVTARAGAIADAWTSTSDPSISDIEKLIEQVSGEIGGYIAGAGFDPAALDQTAQDALVGITADIVLLLAIDATFQGDRSGVSELRASVKDRVDAYTEALAKGEVAVLLYLDTSSESTNTGGAADFWTQDGSTDYIASLFTHPYGFLVADPFGVAPSQGPAFRKGQRL